MPYFTRIVLSAPFALILIDYLSFFGTVMEDEFLDSFWQNHALRETIFAFIMAGVALNYIWSTALTPAKLAMVAIMAVPLILGFWVATALVGFGDSEILRATYINHVAQVVLFVVGYFMVLTRT